MVFFMVAPAMVGSSGHWLVPISVGRQIWHFLDQNCSAGCGELGPACVKSKVTRVRMPSEDRITPRVGVSCLDRLARIAGRKPRSAIPSSWKLSLLISASNWPIWLTAAAATIHQDSQLPPTCTLVRL